MYFPKSQIKPNLYTNGGELVYKSNLSSYKGPYFSVSSGKFYTGAYPSNSSIELIIPPIEEIKISPLLSNEYDFTPAYALDDDEDFSPPVEKSYIIGGNTGDRKNQTYISLTSIPGDKLIPIPYTPQPTEEEINQEEYLRYFSKSNTQNLYTEINKTLFEQFASRDPLVAFEFYTVTFLSWSLGKNSSQVNKNMVLLKEKELNWYNFHHFFKNQFGSIEDSNDENLYTKGGEFLLPNRTNYIGYYHRMNNGNFMTGKYHGDGPETILISLNKTTFLNSSQSTLGTTSSPSSGGGGGY